MLYTGVVLFVSQGKAHIFSRIAVSRIFAATNKSTTPDNADMVCTRSILGDTVNAPKIPATQPSTKNSWHLYDRCQSKSTIHKDQIKPAARNALYKPWLAAIAVVYSNGSEGKLANTLGPRLVQANISGIKDSGVGREGSKYGIEDYLEIKYLYMDGVS